MNDNLSFDLQCLLNKHSAENSSNTPDFVLAQFLVSCLRVYDTAVQQREKWYGRDARPTEAKQGRAAECSRCLKDLSSLMRTTTDVFTCGYYEVASGTWSKYATPGEVFLCDACMFADSRYIQDHGAHKP